MANESSDQLPPHIEKILRDRGRVNNAASLSGSDQSEPISFVDRYAKSVARPPELTSDSFSVITRQYPTLWDAISNSMQSSGVTGDPEEWVDPYEKARTILRAVQTTGRKQEDFSEWVRGELESAERMLGGDNAPGPHTLHQVDQEAPTYYAYMRFLAGDDTF